MRDSKKQARQDAIIAASYEVLENQGYAGASMLRIAKAAKASNETLYRWYGDKGGLFEAMVRENAAETRALLEPVITGEQDARTTLAEVSPVFLRMILSNRAIALNRAAAADTSGELGKAIAAGGRDQIGPLIVQLLQRLPGADYHAPATLFDWYMAVLVGDLQIRRVIGTLPPLTEAEIAARCAAAHRAFFHLVSLSPSDGSMPG